MGIVEGKTMNIVVVVVLWFLSISFPAFAQEEGAQEVGGTCYVSQEFANNEAVQFMLRVEQALDEADVDMGLCMSDHASSVQGCAYNGAIISIVKNPVTGWGIAVERGDDAYGIWVNYRGGVDVRIDSDTFTVTNYPHGLFEEMNRVIFAQDAQEHTSAPMVSYEVND